MKTTKMTLANIQGKLSRTEMKKIMAGTATPTCSTLSCTDFYGGSKACETQTNGLCHCPIIDWNTNKC